MDYECSHATRWWEFPSSFIILVTSCDTQLCCRLKHTRTTCGCSYIVWLVACGGSWRLKASKSQKDPWINYFYWCCDNISWQGQPKGGSYFKGTVRSQGKQQEHEVAGDIAFIFAKQGEINAVFSSPFYTVQNFSLMLPPTMDGCLHFTSPNRDNPPQDTQRPSARWSWTLSSWWLRWIISDWARTKVVKGQETLSHVQYLSHSKACAVASSAPEALVSWAAKQKRISASHLETDQGYEIANQMFPGDSLWVFLVNHTWQPYSSCPQDEYGYCHRAGLGKYLLNQTNQEGVLCDECTHLSTGDGWNSSGNWQQCYTVGAGPIRGIHTWLPIIHLGTH